MVEAIHLGFLVLALAAGGRDDSTECVRIEPLSERVLLAHWIGPDRLCNLAAIRSQKGLVLIDTERNLWHICQEEASVRSGVARRY